MHLHLQYTARALRDQRAEPYNPCDHYGISAIPTTILINKEGVIVGRNLNEAEIEEILNKYHFFVRGNFPKKQGTNTKVSPVNY